MPGQQVIDQVGDVQGLRRISRAPVGRGVDGVVDFQQREVVQAIGGASLARLEELHPQVPLSHDQHLLLAPGGVPEDRVQVPARREVVRPIFGDQAVDNIGDVLHHAWVGLAGVHRAVHVRVSTRRVARGMHLGLDASPDRDIAVGCAEAMLAKVVVGDLQAVVTSPDDRARLAAVADDVGVHLHNYRRGHGLFRGGSDLQRRCLRLGRSNGPLLPPSLVVRQPDLSL
mmetsp:Transcript_23967/g.67234  ORF Transcript_23967/g.67234 Transcript_23967/m.67234 type:complete len:228 (-) Transcript_23967:618-1301(-)